MREKNDIEEKISELEKYLDLATSEKASIESNLNDKSTKLQQKEQELQIQSEKMTKIIRLNEELRDLIEQERLAYNEERLRAEEEQESSRKSIDTKLKLFKNKLLVLVSSMDQSCYQSIQADTEGPSIDEIIKTLADYIS